MKKLKCNECRKVIEGYNLNHVEHLMEQHKLTHKKRVKE